jgi:hypothetical protein
VETAATSENTPQQVASLDTEKRPFVTNSWS